MARGFLSDVVGQISSGVGTRVEAVDERVTGAIDAGITRIKARVARVLLGTSYVFRILVLVRASAFDRSSMVILVAAVIPLHYLRLIAKQELRAPRRYSVLWRALPLVATLGIMVAVFAISRDVLLLIELALAEILNYAGRRILADIER